MKTKLRPQAERSSKAQVDLEIQRRRALREKYITDNDEPHWVELVATALILVVAFAWYALK